MEILAEAESTECGLVLLDMELGLDANGADLVLPLTAAGWRMLVMTRRPASPTAGSPAR